MFVCLGQGLGLTTVLCAGRGLGDTWIRGYVVHCPDPYEAPSEANLEGTRRGEEGQTLCRTAREQGGSPLADCTGARPRGEEAAGWIVGVVDEQMVPHAIV